MATITGSSIGTPPLEAASSDAEAACSTDGRVPLVALLVRTERAFNAEFDRRLARTEFAALSLAHSRNVLRHLGSGPIRASQITAMSEVSKQALSQQIAQLERAGYVSVTPDPADHRARVLALTATGERAHRLVEQLFVAIEDDWISSLGEDVVRLRPILARLLEQLPTGAACAPAGSDRQG